jgi:hypothetical protein
MAAGRKRTELGSDVEARIALGVRRGETAAQITRAIGGAVSSRTIGRRVREIRGPVQAHRPSVRSAPTEAAPASLPSAPDDIPDEASLPDLYALLERCKTALAQAEADRNLPLVGQMIRVASSLSETIRKATPPKQPDPNDAPDMVALRVEAARKWHEMIDLVADENP